MRTNSLAIALAATFATTLIACGGHDDPAPPADQTAAVVAPTQPTDSAGKTTTGSTSSDAKSTTTDPAAPASADKKDDPATTTATPPAKADDGAFAGLAQQLNDCLKGCTDATCGSACLSDFQANLPATPDVPTGNAMCCSGDAFFVCHAADGADATCNAADPGPNCQPVPQMDVICKAKGGDQ